MLPIIRKAIADDLNIIYQFEQIYIEEIEPENLSRWQAAETRIKQQLADNLGRMFVLADDNSVLGHCFWDVYDGLPHICSIFVAQEYRQRGFASKLMQVTEADCQAHGFAKWLLQTHETNPAQYLFQSLDYAFIECKDSWYYYEKFF